MSTGLDGQPAGIAAGRGQSTMPTLFETIRNWREAHRKLSQRKPAPSQAHQQIIERLVCRLQRHRSLADLARGYYDDGGWWIPVVREFCVDDDAADCQLLRDTAYYLRLLQIRRPFGR